MKKLTLLTVFAYIMQAGVFSQSCLPEGIAFINQIEKVNFQTKQPG